MTELVTGVKTSQGLSTLIPHPKMGTEHKGILTTRQ